MQNVYINQIELFSNKFVLRQENFINLKNLFKEISESHEYLLFLNLSYDNYGNARINIFFNPQHFYFENKHEYKKHVDYKKFNECINTIQEEIDSSIEGFDIEIEPLSSWGLSKIEIAKNIQLRLDYFYYIDILNSLKSKHHLSYSLLVEHDYRNIIYYYNRSQKNHMQSYSNFIKFENLIRQIKFYSDDKELKENILQSSIMLKDNINLNFKTKEGIAFKSAFYLLFRPEDEDNNIVNYIKLKDIIHDYKNNLINCEKYLLGAINGNLFHQDVIMPTEIIKDDDKLLEKIIKETSQGSDKHILYFIIVKLLSELKDYNLKKIVTFLNRFKNLNIKKHSRAVINKINFFRISYYKNFQSYSFEDLYAEIKNKLFSDNSLEKEVAEMLSTLKTFDFED
ncbi:MAG: hypothetical protein A2039_05355 [Candidatus Melainabacteria bacterium GWA2_34_9]|nr:MAG: hypothetical protein A2039_05355 [Candidatus Melainabacteria bacterium GWA2_34_9]